MTIEEFIQGLRDVRTHPNYQPGDVRLWADTHAFMLLQGSA